MKSVRFWAAAVGQPKSAFGGEVNRDELAQDIRNMSRQDFVERHPTTVLIGEETVDGELGNTDPFARAATLLHEPDEDRAPLDSGRVFELPGRSRSGKDVSAVLGRTSQSDVIIVDYTISKIHARYTPPRLKEPASVTDLGSSNGTWMDGARIAKNEPTPLQSGMKLRLGRIVLRYYEPFDLYDRLLKAR